MLNILLTSQNTKLIHNTKQGFASYFDDIKLKVHHTFDFSADHSFVNIVIVDLDSIKIDAHFFTSLASHFSSSSTPVLLLSEKQEYALLDESWEYIKKPLDIDALCNKIRLLKKLLEYEKQLEQEKKFAVSIMNSALCPIFVADKTQILFTNNAFGSVFNPDHLDLTQHEMATKLFFDAITHLNHKAINAKKPTMRQLVHNIKDSHIPIVVTNAHHKEYYFDASETKTDFSNLHVILLKDKTNEVLQDKELKTMLYTDGLTKLPNRARLIEDLQNEKKKINSLALLDINSFKEINDFYGNKTGDFILKSIAEHIAEELHHAKGTALYKMPSDVYCISNSKLTQERFSKLISGLLEGIYKRVFTYEGHEIDVRITAGLSFSIKNNKLITADIALQAAKRQHKDYLTFYDELDNLKEYQNNMLWTKKLKEAIAKDNIIVYYQPLINNATMKADKYECLVRMIDGDKIVSPFFFLDISKKSNQYTKITKIVIEKSFQTFANLKYDFSINVSYEDIEDPYFYNFIKNQIALYPGIAHRVVFEILEDEHVKNYDVLIGFIHKIKRLGCKVAIDDFGSGYSNFEHLLKMEVDFLKIDASIIKNIAKDESSFKITKTIVEFAKSLKLKTIAEYVESEEIFKYVRDLGVDYSQGFYFSPPLDTPQKYHLQDSK